MLRQLKLWLILLPVLLLSDCAGGPRVKVCISDPAYHGFECYDERTETASFVPYELSDKYVAFDPTDAQTVLTYCQAVK
jgi:hypothetical protein